MSKTYRQCYAWGFACLQEAGIADAKLDARLLLEFVCGTSQHDLLLYGDREVDGDHLEQYQSCIEKRASRIPLQHITGVQDFMGFTFQVNEHVLIPRQDTEVLVETALEHFAKICLRAGDLVRVLDMCTGSGCILLSLLALAENKGIKVSGVGADISPEALNVAKCNLAGISDQSGRKLEAGFVESDLFTKWQENKDGGCADVFDMIVSNPPYIATKVIDSLEPEVRLHEPITALDGTEDGLFFYRKIVTDSTAFLRKGGMLLFEIGYDQGSAVAELMKRGGFSRVTVKKDYAGLDRVVYGFFEEEI